MLAITLVSPDPAALAEAAAAVRAALAVSSEAVGEGRWTCSSTVRRSRRHQAVKAASASAGRLRGEPVENRRKRLLIADMDSTIINVECLDELADFAGVKDKVSEITERAMRGELAFEGRAARAGRHAQGPVGRRPAGLLRRPREAQSRGADPGADHGRARRRCALVSGGFTFFTSASPKRPASTSTAPTP
jgi:phosphoserine phosphatase